MGYWSVSDFPFLSIFVLNQEKALFYNIKEPHLPFFKYLQNLLTIFILKDIYYLHKIFPTQSWREHEIFNLYLDIGAYLGFAHPYFACQWPTGTRKRCLEG
jgi:hypothetical protein